MKLDIILLSGTPASGKDTLTNELMRLDKRFIHFKKHKIASGGKMDDTYYLISKENFDNMVINNEFVQYHYRYDRGYAVSLKELNRLKNLGKIPIIHVGKYENIQSFIDFGLKNILSILIYTNRNITLDRLIKRHLGDEIEIKNRIKAYDEEINQLFEFFNKDKKMNFDIILNNNSNDITEISLNLYKEIII